MKLVESWRFAIKCIKLSYNLKVNLISAGFLFLMSLVYLIMDAGNGMGNILMLTIAMFPAQMMYSVCGSSLVQSSPYRKAIMTSLPAVITFCSGMLIYLTMIGVETVRTMGTPETARQGAQRILLMGALLMSLNIYVGIAYKYFVVSVLLMVGCIMGSYYLIGDGAAILDRFPGISMPMPAAIAAGIGMVVLGSLLQYGVSLLVYKKPISRGAIYGLLRQQA